MALPKNAYIICSLPAHQHVGDRELPLLEVVSLPFAARGAGDQAKEHVYEPKHVKYHPLATQNYQTVQFTVQDEEGHELPLIPDQGATTISIRLEKVEE